MRSFFLVKCSLRFLVPWFHSRSTTRCSIAFTCGRYNLHYNIVVWGRRVPGYFPSGSRWVWRADRSMRPHFLSTCLGSHPPADPGFSASLIPVVNTSTAGEGIITFSVFLVDSFPMMLPIRPVYSIEGQMGLMKSPCHEGATWPTHDF